MKIETQDLEYCKIKVYYEADRNDVDTKITEAISELRKLPIPGYRPGKAPDHAIKVRAKKQLQNWVAQEMSAQAYDDVIGETKIKPIGYPNFSNVKLEANLFSCEMTIMKKPEFILHEYKELEVPRPHLDRDVEAQIEATLQDLRLKFGAIEPYKDDDFVEKGDQVTMDFVGTIDGKSFDGSTEEGTLYTIGDKRFPEFDDALLGMTPGEEREFDVSLPEDFPEVGGKTAKFKVTLHMGTKQIPCPLNDELAQKVGLQSFDEVKDKLRLLVNDRIQNTETQLVSQQIANQLVEKHDFEVPVWLSTVEAQMLAAQSGLDWKSFNDEVKDEFIKRAEKNVRLTLVLDSIRDAEPEAVLSDAEAIQVIKNQVAVQGVDGDKFIVENQKTGRLHGMVAAMKDRFALEWVVGQAKIIDE